MAGCVGLAKGGPFFTVKPFRHLVIFGVIGSGKTSLAYHFTRKERRLIIVDTAEEKRYESAGVHVYDPDDVGKILQELEVFRIVFRSDNEDDLRWLFRVSRAAKNLVILVEEAGEYNMGAHAELSDDFRKTVRFGRHDGVKIVATTQRPADVHKLLISQSEILLGKVWETNDARYLKGMGGVTKETIEAAARLPDPVVKDGRLSISYLTPLDNKSRTVVVNL